MLNLINSPRMKRDPKWQTYPFQDGQGRERKMASYPTPEMAPLQVITQSERQRGGMAANPGESRSLWSDSRAREDVLARVAPAPLPARL